MNSIVTNRRYLDLIQQKVAIFDGAMGTSPVSYTHLRAHETVLDLVCRLLLEKKTYTSPPTPFLIFTVRCPTENSDIRASSRAHHI